VSINTYLGATFALESTMDIVTSYFYLRIIFL